MAIPMIKVARDGYDIQTAGDRFLNIDSTKNQLKGYLTGGCTISINLTNFFGTHREIVEIEHNLGYQPFFMGFARDSSSSVWSEMPSVITADEYGDQVWVVLGRPNDNIIQIGFEIMHFAAPVDIDIDIDVKYIIFVDPFNDAWF